MSNPIDTDPANQTIWLLTATYGTTSPTTVRYASWDEPTLTVGADTFTGVPSMEVDLQSQHGGSRDVPAIVTMEAKTPFDDAIDRPYPPITITIEQYKFGDASSRRTLFYGRFAHIVEAPEEVPGTVKITVRGIKSDIGGGEDITAIPLGVQCNEECSWRFGDDNCQYSLASRSGMIQTGSLTIVQGSTVRVAGLTPNADLKGTGLEFNSKLFFRGVLVGPDDTEIDVRDYTGDDLGGSADETLILDEAPPASWAGQTVTVVAGCIKTSSACTERNNVEHFLGVGIRMPSHHPQYEEGD